MGRDDVVLISPRHVALARVGWGMVLLLAPRPVMRRVHHVRADRAGVVVARVLGVRQVGQGLVSAVWPESDVLVVGVGVDAVHSASMVGLAAVDRGRARGALTDAVLAGGWAVLGYKALRSAGRP